MTKGASKTVLKYGKVPVMSETSVLKMLGANHISGIQHLVGMQFYILSDAWKQLWKRRKSSVDTSMTATGLHRDVHVIYPSLIYSRHLLFLK